MIVPAVHYGRDGLVAVVLIAQRVTSEKKSLRELADALPALAMIKTKLARPDEAWPRIAARLSKTFAGMDVDEADGLRFSRGDEWVHVRSSGTEPVVRVIAESPGAARTRELVDQAGRALRDGD